MAVGLPGMVLLLGGPANVVAMAVFGTVTTGFVMTGM